MNRHDDLLQVIGRYTHLLPHELEREFAGLRDHAITYSTRASNAYRLQYSWIGSFEDRTNFRLNLPALMLFTTGEKKMLPPFERYDDCSYLRVGLYLNVVAVLQGADVRNLPRLTLTYRPYPSHRYQEFKFSPDLAALLLREQALRYETRSQKAARLQRESPPPLGEGQMKLF